MKSKKRATEKALTELRAIIKSAFPESEFEVFEGDDPHGTYLRAIVDVEDMNDVIDVFINRLMEFQEDDDLDVYVVVSRPRAAMSAP